MSGNSQKKLKSQNFELSQSQEELRHLANCAQSQSTLDINKTMKPVQKKLIDGDMIQRPKTPPAQQNIVQNQFQILKSPNSKKKAPSVDRFISERKQNVDLSTMLMLKGGSLTSPKKYRKVDKNLDSDIQKEEANKLYQTSLQSEMLGTECPVNTTKVSNSLFHDKDVRKVSDQVRILQFKSPQKAKSYISCEKRPWISPLKSVRKLDFSNYLHSPDKLNEKQLISPRTMQNIQNVMKSSSTERIQIPKLPFKVLDAPDLTDDFYLNLLDWGNQNILAVGLGSCVYTWNAESGSVSKMCDLGSYDSVTSVNWCEDGRTLAIGTNKGILQLWNAQEQKKIRSMSGHQSRIGAISWKNQVLCSGSRDRSILIRDSRLPENYIAGMKLLNHTQEVCGLKWSPDGSSIASGGNDNKLMIWDFRQMQSNSENTQIIPRLKFSEHNAAVKAISWSPHQSGLLVSGGGTADRRIRFWNTQTGQHIQCIDTGSQVCNLAWSKYSHELVSTHGYSQNQIVIWKCPTMTPIATLTGHTYRVLYLSCSPDGQSIVTGAGDETLRFWNVFNKKNKQETNTALDISNHRLR